MGVVNGAGSGDEGGGHLGALAGVKVLDFSRVLSGPFATMILGDLGADVVKVEEPTRGDDTRQWGPPFQGGESCYFLSVNRSKRSVALDLRSPAGQLACRQLVGWSDVLVENFRPGVAERLGLGYRTVAELNPRLVYASISGFGQTGPRRTDPGYDAIAQALSGMMSLTGVPDGPPVRPGVATADLGAGMWTVIGILAALQARVRSGRGQRIDVSLLDGQISWLSYAAAGFLATGRSPGRLGSAHPTIVPYQAFLTADGYVMVAVGNDGLWTRFADAVGLADLSDDPRYVTNPDRVRNRDSLVPIIADALRTRSTEEWTAVLGHAGIPVAPINDIGQALSDEQVVSREMVVSLEHPTAGTVRSVATAVKMSESPVAPSLPPPTLGEHTGTVLSELGLSAAAVAAPGAKARQP